MCSNKDNGEIRAERVDAVDQIIAGIEDELKKSGHPDELKKSGHPDHELGS